MRQNGTATVYDYPLAELQTAVSTQIIGQSALITRVLVALLADGHVLLEGVSGLAKTLLVRTVARAISAQFASLLWQGLLGGLWPVSDRATCLFTVEILTAKRPSTQAIGLSALVPAPSSRCRSARPGQDAARQSQATYSTLVLRMQKKQALG